MLLCSSRHRQTHIQKMHPRVTTHLGAPVKTNENNEMNPKPSGGGISGLPRGPPSDVDDEINELVRAARWAALLLTGIQVTHPPPPPPLIPPCLSLAHRYTVTHPPRQIFRHSLISIPTQVTLTQLGHSQLTLKSITPSNPTNPSPPSTLSIQASPYAYSFKLEVLEPLRLLASPEPALTAFIGLGTKYIQVRNQ